MPLDAGPAPGRLRLEGSIAFQVDGVVGPAVTGSRRVQLGRPAALRPLVVTQLSQTVARRRRTLLLAVLAGAVLVTRRRRDGH